MRRIDSSVGAYAVCMLLSCLLSGCADSSQNLAGVVRDRMGRMSLKSSQDADNAERLCDETARLLYQGPSLEAREAIRQLGDYYKRIEFDERTYSLRADSISRYYNLVRRLVDVVVKNPDLSEHIWCFQLVAFERINLEIERCRQEPPGGPSENIQPGQGHFLTQRQYLSDLEAKRFRFFREGFETGPFACYFHSLPDASRNEWIERLDAVAHRKVVIWDPRNQMMEMPALRSEKAKREAGSEDDERIEWLGNGATLKMRPVKNPTRK